MNKKVLVLFIAVIIIIAIIISYWDHSSLKNKTPIANAGDDITVDTNQLIYLNGEKSDDPDGYITNYTWEFSDGHIAFGIKVNHSFKDNGNFTVTLTVIDNEDGKDNDTINVIVNNVAPNSKPEIIYFRHTYIRPPSLIGNYTASHPHYKKTIYTNESDINTFDILYFSGSNSTDSDGHISNYTWIFDDGSIKYGIETSYHFPNDGIHLVTLKVQDDDGTSSSNTVSVNILNRHPFAYVGDDRTVRKKEYVTFNASFPKPLFPQAKSYDPDGFLINYTWEFGDGYISYGEVVSHNYLENGTFQLNLTVTDDNNNINKDSILVVVSNVPPIAEAGDYIIGNITESVFFNGSGYDKDGEIIYYEWDFEGDGIFDWNSSENGNISYIFNEMGIFIAKLKVIDNDGAIGFDMVKICIGNGTSFPPIAKAELSRIDPEDNTSLYFDKIFCNASPSINIDGNNLTYYWDFGDGETESGMVVNHTYLYSKGGYWNKSSWWGYHESDYQITLTVSDGKFTDFTIYEIKIYIYTGPWCIPEITFYISEKY